MYILCKPFSYCIQGMEEKAQRNTVIFNASKRELFTINNGFKTLNRKLRTSWKVTV